MAVGWVAIDSVLQSGERGGSLCFPCRRLVELRFSILGLGGSKVSGEMDAAGLVQLATDFIIEERVERAERAERAERVDLGNLGIRCLCLRLEGSLCPIIGSLGPI